MFHPAVSARIYSSVCCATLLFAMIGCGDSNKSSSIPSPNLSPDTALAAPAPPSGVSAIVDNYKNNATTDAGVTVLSQYNSLWTPGSTYNTGTVLNSSILSENVQYTASVTSQRDTAQEVAAYMDDRRDQSYSVLDGLGPLYSYYLTGAAATTTIPTSFDANTLATTEYDDAGSGDSGGSTTSTLGSLPTLIQALRSISTTPAKKAYNYPRPWRLNSSSVVVDDGPGAPLMVTDINGSSTTTGNRTWETYSSPVTVAPSLMVVRSTNPATDYGFPSGHENAAMLASLAVAYAVPERYQEMITRAYDLGNNRIVAGMHDPLDVMGGRVMATAWAAAILYNDYSSGTVSSGLKAKAYSDAHTYFYAQTDTDVNSLYTYAHSMTSNEDRFANWAINKANVTTDLTYGFPQINSTSVAPLVPKGAEVLLETRQPYLTADQRRWEIYTTELPSGYPLLDDAEGWGRINLFAAADGMGSLNGNVFVTMDSAKGGFNAADTWRNNISGTGTLYKRGTGTLHLKGSNTYSGGTQIDGGTLEAESAGALGDGHVILNSGTLICNAAQPVTVVGDFNEPSGSTLELNLAANNAGTLFIQGQAAFNGTLNVALQSGFTPVSGTTYTLISTNGGHLGTFKSINVSGTTASYTLVWGTTGLTIKF